MREEWSDPRQADVVEYFTEAVQEAAGRRGIRACGTCHGIGQVVMVDHVAEEPFTIACSSCGL